MAHRVQQEELDDFVELWRKAEARTKRVERLWAHLLVPSVNELRYAGYHLVEALTNDTDAGARDLIANAKKHAKRATYDACEAEVLFRLEQVQVFRNDFRKVEINVQGVDYPWVRRVCREAQALVRSWKGSETREEHYATMMQYADDLERAVAMVDDAREELNKKLKKRRYGALTVAIAAIAAFATGVLATMEVLKYIDARAARHQVMQSPSAGTPAGQPRK